MSQEGNPNSVSSNNSQEDLKQRVHLNSVLQVDTEKTNTQYVRADIFNGSTS